MGLWEDFEEDGFATLSSLIGIAAESQTLELKEKEAAGHSHLSTTDKKNLGKSLSAFSNATGGLVIWGVATNQVGDDSVAGSLKPIVGVEKFASNLHSLLPENLTPPNHDIATLIIEDPKINGAGYVVLKVGPSDNRPHMSTAPGHHTYFLRVHASSKPMADFQVRDMLRVKTTPQLSVGYQINRISINSRRELNDPEHETFQIQITVYNGSELSAFHPYLLFPSRGRDYQPMHGFEWLPHLNALEAYQAERQFIVHPGMEVGMVATTFEVEIRKEKNYRVQLHQGARWIDVTMCPPVVIDCSVGCENTPARKVSIQVGGNELERAIDKGTYVHSHKY